MIFIETVTVVSFFAKAVEELLNVATFSLADSSVDFVVDDRERSKRNVTQAVLGDLDVVVFPSFDYQRVALL